MNILERAVLTAASNLPSVVSLSSASLSADARAAASPPCESDISLSKCVRMAGEECNESSARDWLLLGCLLYASGWGVRVGRASRIARRGCLWWVAFKPRSNVLMTEIVVMPPPILHRCLVLSPVLSRSRARRHRADGKMP